MALVTRFNYSTWSSEPVPATEDFVEVFERFDGGYDWQSFHAYYSPSARRYFWFEDSGCSCNGPMESLDSIEDFSNGSRADLLAAWNRWTESSYAPMTPDEKLDGVRAIRNFKEES